MKPSPFTYHAPTRVDEALATLAEFGDQGKVLAGGQSLIPLLNMRLAAPAHLIDINGLAELGSVDVTADTVRIGAIARHADVEHHAEMATACPLLVQALRLVAHPVIRNRGTVCGSIAHADPAGELTAVLALLGGTVQVACGGDGAAHRNVASAEFFVGPLESALEPGDLVTSVTVPRVDASAGSAFVELARRHGDYALCGVGALVELGDDGSVVAARAGYISVHPTPLVVDFAAVVHGSHAPDWQAAGEEAAARAEPETDLHATADYRRHLIRVLTARALAQAADHARARRAAA